MLLNLIEERCSVRKYSEKEPSIDDIKYILKAGHLAPSWVNVQPWKFIITKNEKIKDMLCELSNGQQQVKKAPYVIVCIGDLESWSRKNYEKILRSRPNITEERIEQLLNNPALNPSLKNETAVEIRTVEQLVYPIAYMTLAAREKGLDSCIIGAVGNEITDFNLEKYKKVKETLGLSQNHMIISLLTIGYAEGEPYRKKVRKDFDNVFFIDKIDKKID